MWSIWSVLSSSEACEAYDANEGCDANEVCEVYKALLLCEAASLKQVNYAKHEMLVEHIK